MPPVTLDNAAAFVFQSSVLAIGAAAALAVFNVERATVRYALWRTVLAMSLLLPALQPWSFETIVIAPMPTFTPQSAPASAVTAHPGATAPYSWLAILWIAGVTARLLWLSFGAGRLWRLARREGDACEDAIPLQRALGTRATVRYTRGIHQPATCGIVRPLVLLPPRLRALDADVRRAVLVHELLHVKRGDWARLILEELVRAALWFNPATWWLIDQVHGAREEVVDSRAAALSGGRRPYVRALLEFSGERALAATPAFAHRRHLVARITRLCKEPTMSIRRVVFATVLAVACVSLAASAAVAAFPLSAADEILVAPALQPPPPPPPQPVRVPPPPPPKPAVVKKAVPPPPPPVKAEPPAPPQVVSKAPEMPPPPPPVPAEVVQPPSQPVQAPPPTPPVVQPPPPPKAPVASGEPPAPPIVVEQRVFIDGQVRNPGEYVLKPGMTIGQLVALAGGYTDRARKGTFSVARKVEGKKKTVNAKDKDVLQPGDFVTVATRWW